MNRDTRVDRDPSIRDIKTDEQMLELDPQAIEVRLRLGKRYEDRGELEPAIAHYQILLEQRPGWLELRSHLARLLLKLGYLAAATRHYEYLLDRDDKNVDSRYHLGLALEQQGLWKQAIESYKKAILLQSDRLDARSNLGCLLAKSGQYHAALQELEMAIAIAPVWASAYNNKGQVLAAMGREDEAIAAYLQAIQIDPKLSLAHQNLGQLFQIKGYHTSAIACFQKVLERQPNSAKLLENYGFSCLKLERFSEALSYWKQALSSQKIDLEIVKFYINGIRDLNPNETYNRATIACGQFLDDLLKNDSSQTIDRLAQVYVNWGDVQREYRSYLQAEECYRQALKLRPQDLEIEKKLGLCKIKKEDLQAIESPTLSSTDTSILPVGIYQRCRDWLVDRNLHFDRYFECSDRDRPKSNDKERAIIQLQPNSSQLKCQGVNCQPCLNELHQWFAPVSIQNNIYYCQGNDSLPDRNHDRFVSIIPQGHFWCQPFQSWWNACEAVTIISPDNFVFADLSREYPGQLPNCQEPSCDKNKFRIFSVENLPDPTRFEETVAILSSLSGNVYFHWIVDVLPRIGILQASGFDWDKIDRFVVNSVQRSFQKETLQLLGVSLEKVVESDRYLYIQAKRLVVPSFSSAIGWLSPKALTFLRQQFLPLVEQQFDPPEPLFSSLSEFNNSPELIYVTRCQARYRKIVNESEIRNHLENLGFVTILPETLSFLEQVRLFANAKIVVAPHGAGLTNIVFCQPHSTVIELTSPNYRRYYYWRIAYLLNLEYYTVLGKSIVCHPIRKLMYPATLVEDIYIDLRDLITTLRILKSRAVSF